MTAETEKQKKERSRAYPGATLEDSVENVKLIKRNLGKGAHDRESLAKAMGFDKVTGAANQRVAAMVHFGLLTRSVAGYELAPTSARITDPVTEDEKRQELQEAFARPTLYRALLEKFRPDGRVPLQLATHLHRFHGITDGASSTAAEIFMESGMFAGVLDAEGKIIGLSAAGDDHQRDALKSAESNGSSSGGKLNLEAQDQGRQQRDNVNAKSPQHMSTAEEHLAPTQRFEFAITGGKTVSMTVPASMTESDLKIIRKQIELLELQAGIDKSA